MTDAERTSGTTDADGQGTNRRTFLTVAGATAATGLAGCLGGSDDGGANGGDNGTESSGSDGNGDDGPFNDVSFEEGELMVTPARDAVATVNAFYDGEEIGSADVSTGAEQVTVYTAGQTLNGEEIRLVAVDSDGNQIGETTESFAAQPEVTGIRSQAVKNDREPTEEAAKEYTEEFRTALVTIENTGDGPLFLGKWRYTNREATTVFLTDGVPQTVGSDKRSELDEADDDVLVPTGGSVEVVPYAAASLHLEFNTSDGEKEEWPESVRSMGEFPDGYADGDEVDVTVVVKDNTGEEVEDTVTATYDGGLSKTNSTLRDEYVPLEFATEG